MALDLGTISGVIGLDAGPFDKVLDGTKSKLQTWAASTAKEAEKGGEEGGKRFADGWGKKALVLLGAGGLAVAGAFSAAVVKGMNLEPVNDKLAASMKLNEEEAGRMSRAAGKLYADNWGESMEDASSRTALLMDSMLGLRDASEDELARIGGLFSAFADGFEIDMGRSTQVVGQMIRQGLVGDAEEGVDLLTAVLQQVPSTVREDVLDAVDEYTPYFQQLGIEAGDMMTVISMGADQGAIGIDKMGDAVKELGIRAKDGSKSTMNAYKELGLNGKQMTQQIAAGGEEAQAATQQLAERLLEVEDPAKRSQLSIALFGTQMEDLGPSADNLLSALSGAEDGFDDVAGSAAAMGEQINGNAKANITSFLRALEVGATEYIGGKILPALNDLTGLLITDWGPALQAASDHLATFGRWVQDNAGWLGPLATAVGVFGAALGLLGLAGYIASLGGLGGAFVALATNIGLTTIATNIKAGAEIAASAASKAFAAGQWLVNAALSANPIGLVVLALAGLVTALVVAYQNSEDFRRIVDGALGAVKAGADAVVKWFNNDFLGFWKGAFDSAKTTVEGWGRGVDDTVKAVQNWFSDTGKKIGEFAGGVGRSMGDAAKWVDDRGKDVRNFVAAHFGDAMRVGTSKLVELKDGGVKAFDNLKSFVSDWGKAFGKLLNGDFEGFNQDANKIMGRMKDGLMNVFNGVKDGAKRIWDMLPADLKRPIQDAVKWINNTFVNGINGLLGKINISFRVPRIAGFASGGYTGNGGKHQVAGLVHAGEVVWSQDDVAAHGGASAVDEMRRARPNAFPGYAGGGRVVPNAAQGWRNYQGSFLSALNAWAAETGRTWYMTGNGGARSRADQERAYALYKAGRGPLAARPGTSAHEFGLAIDVSPRPGEDARSASLLSKYGLGLTVRGEPWHIGMPGGNKGLPSGGFNPLGFMDLGIGKFIDSIIGGIPGGDPWKSVVAEVIKKTPQAIEEQAMKTIQAVGSAVGTARWSPVASQALLMTGQSLGNLPSLLRRMNQESGGNPRAINLWDSNAKKGIPSKGLMQVIDPTFARYAMPGHSSDIYDPLSNILASIRYALARYGSLPAAYDRKGGYAMGTNYADPGASWVAENGAELVLGRSVRNFRGGEQVLNAAQTARVLGGVTNHNVFHIRVDADDLDQVKDVVTLFEGLELDSLMTGEGR